MHKRKKIRITWHIPRLLLADISVSRLILDGKLTSVNRLLRKQWANKRSRNNHSNYHQVTKAQIYDMYWKRFTYTSRCGNRRKWNFLQLFLRSMMPLRSPSTLLITRMITDRIRLHSVLLPLLVCFAFFGNYRRGPKNLFSWFRSDWPWCFLVVWAPNCCMFAHQLTMFRVQIYQQWVCLKWFLNEGMKIYWEQ